MAVNLLGDFTAPKQKEGCSLRTRERELDQTQRVSLAANLSQWPTTVLQQKPKHEEKLAFFGICTV